MDIFGQFWNVNIAINTDQVGITTILGFYSNTLSRVLLGSQDRGAGGNGEKSPRGGAVMGNGVRGAGRQWGDKRAGQDGCGFQTLRARR